MKNQKALLSSICLLTISGLLLISCKKEELSEGPGAAACPSTNGYFGIEDPEYQNMFYITGTYWNYIDSVNNTTDSMYITDFANSSFVTNCSNTVEKYDLTIRSASGNQDSYFYLLPGGLQQNENLEYTDNKKIFESSGSFQYDSLYVYDQFYYNVSSDYHIDQNTGDSLVYYINSDYGFLRIEKHVNGVLTSEKILKSKAIVR